jgi:hypothetical protein
VGTASNICGLADVMNAGWYTLRPRFTDDGGVLAVIMTVLADAGTGVTSMVHTTATDTIPDEVGGNRYAWFAYIMVPGGWRGRPRENGGYETFGFRNEGQCIAAFLATSRN